jgi:hypothetical protein
MSAGEIKIRCLRPRPNSQEHVVTNTDAPSAGLALQPEWFDRWWQPADFIAAVKAYKQQHSPNFEMMYRR